MGQHGARGNGIAHPAAETPAANILRTARDVGDFHERQLRRAGRRIVKDLGNHHRSTEVGLVGSGWIVIDKSPVLRPGGIPSPGESLQLRTEAHRIQHASGSARCAEVGRVAARFESKAQRGLLDPDESARRQRRGCGKDVLRHVAVVAQCAAADVHGGTAVVVEFDIITQPRLRPDFIDHHGAIRVRRSRLCGAGRASKVEAAVPCLRIVHAVAGPGEDE